MYEFWWLRCRKEVINIILGSFTIASYRWFFVWYSTVVRLLYSVDYLFGQGGGGASDSEIFVACHVASRIVASCAFHLLILLLSNIFWHILLSFLLQVKSFYCLCSSYKVSLIFVVDESQSSASTSSGLASKSAYIPRRLVIGNDEYAHSYFSALHILCNKFHHCCLV